MQTASSSQDRDSLYRDHDGAPMVSLVFRLVDWYLRARERQAAAHLARWLGPSWQRKARLFSSSRGSQS